jgi:hypothetical protein
VKHALVLAVLAAVIASTPIARADTPTMVTFTARLVDDQTEKPITGDHVIVFALFDADVDGHSVWTETHDVSIDDGLVFLELGDTTALDKHVFDGGSRWLQVSVDGNVMDPRIAIDSVPYAVRAAAASDADTIGGVPLADLQQKITGACNQGQYLQGINGDGSVVCAPDTAGAGDITDVIAGSGLAGGASTGAATLSLMTCGMNEVLKSSGAGWACGADNDSGDITAVTVGSPGGLVGGGTSGAVTLSLPGTCATGQVLKWNGSVWGCANDVDTDTNSGGTITGVGIGSPGGLVGGGTSGNVALSLPGTCATNQVLKWNGTVWGCANDVDTDTNSGGTITGVVAGNGLTGGGSTGNVTVHVGQGVGVVVQADTVGLDTAYTDLRYLMLSGGTMTGGINMSGQRVTNRGCPSGYTAAGSGLCFETSDQCCYTFTGAANRCRAAGTHLCTAAEMRAVMASGITIGGGATLDWMADQSDDDTALYVNDGTSAENPDGTRATTSSSWSRCCATVE